MQTAFFDLDIHKQAMLQVTEYIKIEDWEFSENFKRSSGPGGQNINKVSSAVELRFEAARSPSLTEPVKVRLKGLAGRKWNKDGAIVLQCDKTRHQSRNRDIVRERLKKLIRDALVTQKPRLATRPTAASNNRRIVAKKHRAGIKSNRSKYKEKFNIGEY